jgi:hypothetical protein
MEKEYKCDECDQIIPIGEPLCWRHNYLLCNACAEGLPLSPPTDFEICKL